MSDAYDALKLENQICFPLYLCAKEIVNRYTPYLKELDLTYTQYVVMMYLWERGESNLRTLGRALLLDSGTLTPLLKKLEQKGYVFRRRSSEDERSLIVTLTSQGDALKTRALKIPEQMRKCLDLDPADAAQLYALVYKTLEILVRGKGEGA